VEGDDGSRFEATAHLTDYGILCNLKGVNKALDVRLGGEEGESVGQNRKDERVEETMPVRIV